MSIEQHKWLSRQLALGTIKKLELEFLYNQQEFVLKVKFADDLVVHVKAKRPSAGAYLNIDEESFSKLLILAEAQNVKRSTSVPA